LSALVVLLAVACVLIIALGLWLVATANRLDRLHERSDAAREALEAALCRRATVARSVAATRVDDVLHILIGLTLVIIGGYGILKLKRRSR